MQLPVATGAQTRTFLRRILNRNRRQVWLTLAFQLLATIFATILPSITGRTLDAIAAGTTVRLVVAAIVAMVVVVLLQIVCTFVSENYAGLLAESISRQLRDQVVTTVAHLPLGMVEQAGSGDLLGRVSYDVRQIQSFVGRGIQSILRVVFTLVVTYCAALVVIPQIGWIVVVPLPLLLANLVWFFHRASPLLQCNAALIAQLSGQVSENAQSASTIEAGGLVPLRQDRIGRTVRSSWNLQLTTGLTRAIGMTNNILLLLFPLVLAVLVGAVFVPKGLTSVGAMTTLTMYILQVRSPFTSAMYWVTNAQIAWASLQRLAGVDLVDAERKVDSRQPQGSKLEIKRVDYAYTPGKPVLNQVSLTVNPGETVAIVGTSGAGKSTLARLVAGIDAPERGQVLIGGVSVSTLSEGLLHQLVTLVTQEHHVFTATLRENLLLAREDATDRELLQALSDVEAEWALGLSAGLDTALGAQGYQPTSAQAQQLALARLILQDPKILILDEATSMLDPSSAYQLERALGKVLAGRSVIMIAHRLFTARDADRICVMEQGRIAQLGTHQQLLDQGGIYARLWEAWQA